MSRLSYIIATASPFSLVVAGVITGIFVSNVVGLLVDAIRLYRRSRRESAR